MKKISLILTLIFLSLIFVACSGSSDGGSDPAPQEEEDTGGTTGGTSGGTSGGTTGGTSGGGSACLSTNQKINITNMLDSLSNDSPMTGDTIATIYNDDGTISNVAFPATAFSFGRADATSWVVGYAICTSPTECSSTGWTALFRNGCFYVNDVQAKIISTSSYSISYSIMEDGVVIQSALALSSSGIFRYTESDSVNGRRTILITFIEHSDVLAGIKGTLNNEFKELLMDSLSSRRNEETSIKNTLPLE